MSEQPAVDGWELTRELPRVTRVEVIDDTGRAYSTHDAKGVTLSYQDQGMTMKIFVKGEA